MTGKTGSSISSITSKDRMASGDGVGATHTPFDWNKAISLPESLQRCEQIERLQDESEIHRQFDLLSNEVLCSLGYSELVRRFLARVAEFHPTPEQIP